MKRSLFLALTLVLAIAFPVFLITGCSVSEDAAMDYAGAPAEEMAEPAAATEDSRSAEFLEDADNYEADTEERIIKEGRMEFVTDDVEAKVEEINDAAEEYDAYITDSSLSKINDRLRASLTVRIESSHFDSAYNNLGNIDDLVSKESTSQDVTMEYVDLQRRLEVYRTQEERYLEMLDNAENIEEMLEVEKELGRIRLEIESLQGKINYFDSVTDYSYIDIIVSQRKAVAAAAGTPDNVWEEFLFSLKEGWQFFFSMVVSIAAAVIWGLPFIITIVVILFLVSFIRKKNKDKKTNNNQA